MGIQTSHDRLVDRVPPVLAALLEVAEKDLDITRDAKIGGVTRRADLLINTSGKTIVVECKLTTSAAIIADAARKAREFAVAIHRDAIPLVAVPFMGPVGRRACEDVGVAWIDLSGNGRIVAPGLKIIVAGRPNLFKAVGRPSSVFAPKSARVARQFLMQPNRSYTKREIAQYTNLSHGFVSRIVARLEKEGYLDCLDLDGAGSATGAGSGAGSGSGHGNEDGTGDGSGAERSRVRAFFSPRDPDLLLDAWRDSYQFSKHTILKGHVAARSGDALLRFASDVLFESGLDPAATGLAAAWALTQFAIFRLATIYVHGEPSPEVLDRLGFREDPRGANLWLVVPNDEGIFFGGHIGRNSVQCVNPVQVYLDLKEQPERAREAADEIRKQYFYWQRYDQ
jgi:hypothetical protein